MCGIFGIISQSNWARSELALLATHARQRGRDSSGLVYHLADGYHIKRADHDISRLLADTRIGPSDVVMGHSRLITNGLSDNQPVLRDDVCVLHNGIIVNYEQIWKTLPKTREQEIDTEIIAALAATAVERDGNTENVATTVLEACKGVAACAVAFPKLGKLCLFSNNGSLYVGEKGDSIYFSSEAYPLHELGCNDIRQIRDEGLVIDIPTTDADLDVTDINIRTENLIPELVLSAAEEKLLIYETHNIRRCTKCVLPATMPYIRFNDEGVCNYCTNYKQRNKPKPKQELFDLVEPFRRAKGEDCIVPFSGGRDSCYALHLIVDELKMKPITYTYDWGMVTDLGRRNISRMCAELGV